MVEVALVMVGLSATALGFTVVCLWKEVGRLHQRIATLEMVVRRLSWPPGVAHAYPPVSGISGPVASREVGLA
jgi:hypothetical protein